MSKPKVAAAISVAFVVLICAFPNISIAEIKVYDNNNQYLGILLDMDGDQSMTVFIPPINASYNFSKNDVENPNSCTQYRMFWFEADDCSSIPYTSGPFPYAITFNCHPYAGYYAPDSKSVKQFAPKSILTGEPGTGNPTCNEISFPSALFYEMKEIQLPFTTPIALPLRFENLANTADFFVIPVKKK